LVTSPQDLHGGELGAIVGDAQGLK
jgi:hypothetical protein